MDLNSMMGQSGEMAQVAAASQVIYKANMKKLLPGKTGYSAKIRFLPNLIKKVDPETGAVTYAPGPWVADSSVHFVKVPNRPDMNMTFSCQNTGKHEKGKCPLCDTYFALVNAKREVDAKSLERSKKFWSYIYVIEDKQQPEFEGKVCLFGYGIKIKQKIDAEKAGTPLVGTQGVEVDVYDLLRGKNFNLACLKQGSTDRDISYESSMFDTECSPLKVGGREIPHYKDKNGDLKIGSEDHAQNETINMQLCEFLTRYESTIESQMPKEFTEQEAADVNKVIRFLMNGSDVNASSKPYVAESYGNDFRSDANPFSSASTETSNSNPFGAPATPANSNPFSAPATPTKPDFDIFS